MNFSEITLYSSQLQAQKAFYTELLEFPLLVETPDSFSIQTGYTIIRFVKRADARPYHFAFNIPSWQEEEALEWLKARVQILPSEEEEIIDFINWNAKAIYFYDADHNIVEFIARRNLNIPSVTPFGEDAILEVSEIGIPVESIERAYLFLNTQFQIPIFYGSMETFCAMGGEQGLFIAIDKNKRKWFPKGDQAYSANFEIVFEQSGKSNRLIFEEGKLRKVSDTIPS